MVTGIRLQDQYQLVGIPCGRCRRIVDRSDHRKFSIDQGSFGKSGKKPANRIIDCHRRITDWVPGFWHSGSEAATANPCELDRNEVTVYWFIRLMVDKP